MTHKDLTHYGRYMQARGILFNESRRTVSQYKKMRKDPIIRLGLGFIKMGLGDVPFTVECTHPDETIPLIIHAQYKKIWKRLIRDSLESLEYGFKTFENRYEVGSITYYDEDKPQEYYGQTLRIPKSLDGETIQLLVDDMGELEGFVQDGGSNVLVREGKALVVANNMESGNFYGESDLEYIYIPWYDSNLNRQFGMRWLERKGTGILKGRYPLGSIDVGGVDTDNADYMSSLLSSVIEGTVIAIPGERDDLGNLLWDIDHLDVDDKTDSFIAKEKSLNDLKLRGLIIPERALTQDDIGARASVESFQEMFIQRKQDALENIVDWINEYSVKPFVKMNFGDVEAKIVVGKIDDNSIIVANTIVQKLIESGKMKVESQWLIDKTGIPMEEQEEPVIVEPVIEEPSTDADPDEEEEPDEGKEEKSTDKEKTEKLAEGRFSKMENLYQLNSLESFLDIKSTQFIKDMEAQTALQLERIHKYVNKNYGKMSDEKLVAGVSLRPRDFYIELSTYLNDVYNYWYANVQSGVEGENFSKDFAATDSRVALRVDLTGSKFTNDLLSDIQYSLGNSLNSGYGINQTLSNMDASVEAYLNRLPNIANTESGFAINASNKAYFALNNKLVKTGKLPAEKEIQRYRSTAVLDDKTTELCIELDGLVAEEGSPVIDKFSTPRHYHCRSIWMPITKEMIDSPDYDETSLTTNVKGKPVTVDNVTSTLGNISVGKKTTALDQNLFG